MNKSLLYLLLLLFPFLAGCADDDEKKEDYTPLIGEWVMEVTTTAQDYTFVRKFTYVFNSDRVVIQTVVLDTYFSGEFVDSSYKVQFEGDYKIHGNALIMYEGFIIDPNPEPALRATSEDERPKTTYTYKIEGNKLTLIPLYGSEIFIYTKIS